MNILLVVKLGVFIPCVYTNRVYKSIWADLIFQRSAQWEILFRVADPMSERFQ